MNEQELKAIEVDLNTHHAATRTSETLKSHCRDLLAEVRRLQTLCASHEEYIEGSERDAF